MKKVVEGRSNRKFQPGQYVKCNTKCPKKYAFKGNKKVVYAEWQGLHPREVTYTLSNGESYRPFELELARK